jgi:hypothetical protein
MQENKSITSWEAIERFGATRLSAIIFNLKDKYNIKTTREEFVDRYGNKSHYARYTLLGKRDLEKEALDILKGLE